MLLNGIPRLDPWELARKLPKLITDTDTDLAPFCHPASLSTMMTATDSVLSMDMNSPSTKQQRRQTVSAYPPPTPLDLVCVKAWPSDHSA